MKGCRYGTHRVLKPQGVLPQAALKISNDMNIMGNEILINVQALNIDSASFTQIEKEQQGDIERIKARILEIVNERGKMQNPVTGSGGMLIGTVEKIGEDLKTELKAGDKIATLVSLSLTPLKIESINKIYAEIDRVEITGKAILFESGLYVKLPEDMTENLALAVLDVAGAPAQVSKLVKPCDSVLILGAFGKSGLLCAFEARKRVGPCGRVVGLVAFEKDKEELLKTGFCNEVISADAVNPLEVLKKALEANGGNEYDISINCVNVENTEMSTILPVKDNGTAYFFSMATSFTKAALGAEGVGKDINLFIGNGYTKGHAEIALSELRESEILRNIFEERYVILSSSHLVSNV
ncbi:MAG: L-erythro-3,5-diaminohexanoate dehydrogenase [Bacillota bacterium]|nr:L-erythro-3,5-diaminohexanoate dehydrogenase [Bacillota bacterium]